LIVLDTHAWFWWVSEPGRLSPRAQELIDAAKQIGIATISALEVATLVRKGRLELDREIDAWIGQALAHPRAVELPLDAKIAREAGVLDDAFPADPADRVIYATARAERAVLVTKDAALRRFDPANTAW
jgi:PIN domain nuclease of toxin-antitoxin system